MEEFNTDSKSQKQHKSGYGLLHLFLAFVVGAVLTSAAFLVPGYVGKGSMYKPTVEYYQEYVHTEKLDHTEKDESVAEGELVEELDDAPPVGNVADGGEDEPLDSYDFGDDKFDSSKDKDGAYDLSVKNDVELEVIEKEEEKEDGNSFEDQMVDIPDKSIDPK